MKFEIEVTEQQVLEAIRDCLTIAEYDEDGERTTRGLDVQEIAKRHIRERADAAVARVIADGLKEQVHEQIRLALEEGFTPVNSWGERSGERVTLKSVVAQALTESSRYNRKNVRDIIIEFAKTEIERQVREMVQAARAQIEANLAAAAGDALRNYMRQHAGI